MPHDSLVALFESSCRSFASLPALTSFGTTLSFRQWNNLSLRFARYLQDLGLTRGMRLAIMMPNLLQYPVVVVGALRAGLSVINVNPLFTPRELAQELADSRPDVIVILENFAHVLSRISPAQQPRHIILSRIGDLLPFPKRWLIHCQLRLHRKVPPYQLAKTLPLREALHSTPPSPSPIKLKPEDTAFLQYTGGTTGTPKAAMLSHGNVLANVEQCRLWLTCKDWPKPIRPGAEKLITALPLYHIFALTANLWVGLAIGMHNHLIADPKDANALIRVLKRSRFTCITGVNTLFDHLLITPGFEQVDFSQLRLTLAGGMPTRRMVADRWQQVTGCPVVEGYGLTEASPVVTLNPLDIEAFTGSIGVPLPGTDCRIRDNEHWLPAEQRGELCIRGPQVMQGYWNRPDESRAIFTEDGWLRTGDIARMDAEGFFYIIDRKKDMIIVSGFNVYPREIEEVVAEHPGVRECAAVGLPDPRTGETVKIYVVKSDPGLTEAELSAWCRERLTAYKRPRYIEFCQTLPKSAVGKVLRHRLRRSNSPKP
ncbi:MAG TPA: long-chain-fatty-acid--CoA ligase [Methylothermaceae bacterium]|nr:long-chain-fatty-acid--CoA ligase [Methylothermaceae bacterium]